MNPRKSDPKKLTNNEMFIISKYFMFDADLMNIEKVAKEYRGLADERKKNFQPIWRQIGVDLHPNIETLVLERDANKSAQTAIESLRLVVKQPKCKVRKIQMWDSFTDEEVTALEDAMREENEKRTHKGKVPVNPEWLKNVEVTAVDATYGADVYKIGGSVTNATTRLDLGETKIPVIPESVFERAVNLCELILPNTLKRIEPGQFCKCNKILNLRIPDSVTSIGDFAFSCMTLSTITIPTGVTSLPYGAFYGASVTGQLELPSTLKEIGRAAFYEFGGLETVVIPRSVTSMAGSVFEMASIGRIDLPPVVVIHDRSFQWCHNLTTINIPSTVTAIEKSAFENCSQLQNVNFPSGLRVIGSEAFSHSPLISVKVGSKVERIYHEAFSDCDLQTVSVEGNQCILYDAVFSKNPNLRNVSISGCLKFNPSIFLGTPRMNITLNTVNERYEETDTSLTVDGDTFFEMGFEKFCKDLTVRESEKAKWLATKLRNTLDIEKHLPSDEYLTVSFVGNTREITVPVRIYEKCAEWLPPPGVSYIEKELDIKKYASDINYEQEGPFVPWDVWMTYDNIRIERIGGMRLDDGAVPAEDQVETEISSLTLPVGALIVAPEVKNDMSEDYPQGSDEEIVHMEMDN